MKQIYKKHPEYLITVSMVIMFLFFQPCSKLPAKTGKTLDAKKVYNRVQVLCIGINDYKVKIEDIENLTWAEADAIELSKIFSDRYGYQTKLLLGKNATKQKIQEELETYKEVLSDSDVLIITFSGHGHTVPNGYSREGFLIPADATIDKKNVGNIATWHQETLAMKDITEYVESLNAQHVIFFADVCYSGFLGKRGAAALSGRYDLQMLMRGKSRKVITAGKADQKALENQILQHGVFSWSLLETLKKPGIKSTYDLFVDIRELTAKKSRSKMLPLLRDISIENDGEFVFIPKSLKQVKTDELRRAMAGRNKFRESATTIQDLFSVMEEPDPDFTLRMFDRDYQKFWKDQFQQFEQHATLDNPLAMTALYYFYTKGLGTDRDFKQAKFWAMEAYDTGHKSGLHAMAEYYRAGLIDDANVLIAEKLLTSAAQKGFSPSRLQIASDAIAKDKSQYRQYAKWIEEANQNGSKDAGVLVAIKGSLSKLKNKKTIQEALKRLKEIADTGHARAMYLLAKLYWLNQDGYPPRSESTAWHWLKQAAENGDLWAQLEVAAAYCQFPHWKYPTYRQKKSSPKCRQWAELAGKQDTSGANQILYNYYFRGLAGAPDFNKARGYLDASVNNNEAWALYHAGLHYKDGKIYPRDLNKAKHYLARAAETGEPSANAVLFDIFYREIDWKPFFKNKGVFSSGKDVNTFDEAFQWAGKALFNGIGQTFLIDRIKKIGIEFQQYLIKRAGENWSARPEMLLVVAYCKEAFHPISSYRQTSRIKSRNTFFTTWDSFFTEYAARLASEGKSDYSAVLLKAAN